MLARLQLESLRFYRAFGTPISGAIVWVLDESSGGGLQPNGRRRNSVRASDVEQGAAVYLIDAGHAQSPRG